jgi:hypothetical protein
MHDLKINAGAKFGIAQRPDSYGLALIFDEPTERTNVYSSECISSGRVCGVPAQ